MFDRLKMWWSPPVERTTEPHPFHTEDAFQADELIHALAQQLNEEIKKNESKITKIKSPFYLEKIPNILIDQYIKLADNLITDEYDLIVMKIFLDRYFKNSTSDFLNKHNVHRLLLTSLFVAQKILGDDEQPDMLHFMTACGIRNKADFKILEKEFYRTTDFNLLVSHEVYEETKKNLLNQIEKSKIDPRIIRRKK
jgi:hypothetical protein